MEEDKENSAKSGKDVHNHRSLWYHLYKLHLYHSKGESAFKTIALWICLYDATRDGLSATVFVVLSIAILMEYLMQFIASTDIHTKLLPGLFSTLNFLVFFICFLNLLGQSIPDCCYKVFYMIEIIIAVIVGIDMLLMFWTEPPKEIEVESNLYNCKTTKTTLKKGD